ncbi:MAG: MFS transporter [Gemmataceae bacterium]|jgi:MFS family permease|nr:MFS transporter [Gemmataceae bacterium]
MKEQEIGVRGRWLVLIAALLGWMFDGLEMGLFPLVAAPALQDLLPPSEHIHIKRWNAIITAVFLIGAATGGVVFGWLGDKIGRVRAMTLSVLTYALFSGACGLASAAWQVALFRFIGSLGMGGEWSLGVALVMEVWPNRSRAWLAGVIGAAANFGYAIIAMVSLALTAIVSDLESLLKAIHFSDELIEKLTRNGGWRILMLFGAMPALLTFLIRIFVPESHRWQKEKEKGNTQFWKGKDLLAVLAGACTALGLITLWASDSIMIVKTIGSVILIIPITFLYLYPVIGFVKRAEPEHPLKPTIKTLLLAAGLSGVALMGTWGSTQQAPNWVNSLIEEEKKAIQSGELVNPELPAGDAKEEWTKRSSRSRAFVQLAGALGACFGCVLAALLGGWIGRKLTYMVLCLASMFSIWFLFQMNQQISPILFVSMFLTGAITAAFYGWLPLYLPELFRTKIRATGQGFGFNFGRVIAAIGVLQMLSFQGSWSLLCSLMGFIYLVGLVLIQFAPETKGKPLPE